MKTCLLDTNIIIDAINFKNGRPESLQRLIDQSILLACCSINISEVYMGMRPPEESKRKSFYAALSSIQ